MVVGVSKEDAGCGLRLESLFCEQDRQRREMKAGGYAGRVCVRGSEVISPAGGVNRVLSVYHNVFLLKCKLMVWQPTPPSFAEE